MILAKIEIPEQHKNDFTPDWWEKLNNRYVFIEKEVELTSYPDYMKKSYLVKRANTVFFGNGGFFAPKCYTKIKEVLK